MAFPQVIQSSKQTNGVTAARRAAFTFSASALVIAAALSSQNAQAATINSITINGVTASSSTCTIDTTISFNGTNSDDAGNNDLIQISAQTQGGTRFNAPAVTSALNGTSRSINQSLNISTSSAVRDTYVVRVFDISSSTTAANAGPVIGTATIPRASLVTAGAGCRSIAVNTPPNVSAGPDQTISTGSSNVLLPATASDLDGDTVTFSWQQVSGQAVSVNNNQSATANITLPPQTNQPQTFVFRVTARDGIEISQDDVTITLAAGPNAVPVANAGPNQTVGQGSSVTLSGSGTDGDNDPLNFQWSQVSGPSVTLNNPTSANPTFTAPIPTSGPIILEFQVIADDGIDPSAPDIVQVTVVPNAPPTVNAGPDQAVAGGDSVALSGSGTDPENDPITYQWTQTGGPAVNLINPTSLSPTFLAPPRGASPQVLTFQLVGTDSNNNVSSPDTVEITVAGNQSPSADPIGPATAAGGSNITLDGTTSSDLDGDPLVYLWSQVSGPAANIASPGAAVTSVTLPAKTNSAQTLTFNLNVADPFDASDNETINVTIPANVGPTADAGPDFNLVQGGQGGTLNASGSTDGDGDPLTYNWTQVSGPSVTINNPTSVNATFVAPALTSQIQVLEFEVEVSDGLSTSTDRVEVELRANQAPVADAGPDQSGAGGSQVILDGTGSFDPDSDPIAFTWTQISGPSVTLTGPSSTTREFTAPAATNTPQVLEFQLSVTDGSATSTDTVTFTVAANNAPIAEAGPNATVTAGGSVTLDGTGSSDVDNDPITYSWTQISGTGVSLANATSPTPTFTAPAKASAAQNLVFQLIVNDGSADSIADTVTITVPANGAPLPDAGADQNVQGSSAVTLDASGSSDPDNDPLTYIWTQISGPAVTLDDNTAVQPSFTAPVATGSVQTIVFSVAVDDGFTDPIFGPPSDTVTITIAANQPPVADAGTAQTVAGSSAVTLDATASSDPDGDPITYAWTQTGGPNVVLSDATSATPTFTAPPKSAVTQDLIFEVVVSDGDASSSPAQVIVSVTPNVAPLPEAGADQNVQGGASVTLDASSSSDPDGDALSYNWTQISGPAVTLSDRTAIQPSFTAPVATTTVQTLVFSLAVDDGFGDPTLNPPSDTVTITIAANQPPVAKAGIDQGPIDSGQTVQLDGSGSSDPDGDPLTYTWTQVSGTSVTLSDPTSVSPTFTAPVVNGTEDLVFQLIVSDGQANSTADTVTISVRAVGSVTIIQRVIGSDTQVTFTSDIAALNGTISTSSGSGQLSASAVSVGSYTVTAGDLSAQGYALTDIVCNDSDSTPDTANRRVSIALSPNEELVCTFTLTNSREAASAAIAEFLTGRNALIMTHQPDLQRRLDRLTGAPAAGGSATAFNFSVPGAGGLPFSLAVNGDRATASTSLAMAKSAFVEERDGTAPFDIWTEIYLSKARIGSQEGNFRMIYVGADYRISDGVLIGGLIGLDDFNDDGLLEAGEAEGDGFLAGPYITARLSKDLFAEARAAWGSSDNVVSPLGTFSDEFETTRAFYSGSLIGQFDIGDATRIRPELTVRYIREKQAAYIDSLDITIPEQVVDQGEISFRPRVSHSVAVGSNWTLRPFGEVEGILTFGEASSVAFLNPVAAGPILDLGTLRARVEGGVDLFSAGGVRGSISVFHDGIGSDNFVNTGLHVGLSFGF